MKIFRIKQNQVDLLWQFVRTNFKLRYQNSILGVLWVMIRPYSTFLVLYFLWSNLSSQTIPQYPLYLLLGIVFYTYFQELIIFGQMALIEKAGVIMKVNFPRQIAVISALSNAVINLIINSIFIFVIALVRGVQLSFEGVLYFVFLAFLVFLFSLAISFILSVFTIVLRDLKNIVELGLFLLYWLTPIFYKLDPALLGDGISRVVAASPITIVINQVRAAFGIDGVINWELMIVYLLVTILLLIFSWELFNRKVIKIAEFF